MRAASQRRSRATGLDVRINLVGDPIAGENHGDDGAKDPQDEAPARPPRAERGSRERDVRQIRRAIARVRENAEDQQLAGLFEGHGGLEMRPREDDPGEAEERERRVVPQASRLPELGGGEDAVAEGDGLVGSVGRREDRGNGHRIDQLKELV